jgi:hypothetical protein
LAKDLAKLRRYRLLVVVEVGYIPSGIGGSKLALTIGFQPLRTRFPDLYEQLPP